MDKGSSCSGEVVDTFVAISKTKERNYKVGMMIGMRPKNTHNFHAKLIMVLAKKRA